MSSKLLIGPFVLFNCCDVLGTHCSWSVIITCKWQRHWCSVLGVSAFMGDSARLCFAAATQNVVNTSLWPILRSHGHKVHHMLMLVSCVNLANAVIHIGFFLLDSTFSHEIDAAIEDSKGNAVEMVFSGYSQGLKGLFNLIISD